MTTTIERMATATAPTRRPAIETPRLRLKPAHQACGFVQGAWWPRSTLLTAELPPLLAALSSRFGTIDRVHYHESDWSPTPQHVKHPGGDIVLDSSHDSPNVMSVSGHQFGKLTLLVVPPYTDPTRIQRGNDRRQRPRLIHPRPTTRNCQPKRHGPPARPDRPASMGIRRRSPMSDNPTTDW
jgi:hypothetical protein